MAGAAQLGASLVQATPVAIMLVSWVLQVNALHVLLLVGLWYLGAGPWAGPRVPQEQGIVIPHAGQLGRAARLEHHILHSALMALPHKAPSTDRFFVGTSYSCC